MPTLMTHRVLPPSSAQGSRDSALPGTQLEDAALKSLSPPYRLQSRHVKTQGGDTWDSGHTAFLPHPQQTGGSLRAELHLAPLKVDNKYMMDR